MSSVNLDADFSGAIQETLRYIQLSKEATDALKKWQEATVGYNQVGDKQRVTIRSQISETQQLLTTIKLVDGEYVLASAKIKELSTATLALAKANREAATAAKEAANQEEKRLAAIQKADAAAAKASRAEFLKQTTANSANAVNSFGQLERSRLQQIGVNAGRPIDLSPQSVAQLSGIANQVAKIGTAAGLSTAQLVKLFQQVSSGNIGSIDQKYAAVVQSIQKYNKVIEDEQKRIAGALNPTKKDGGFPKPSTPNLDSLKDYLGFIQRIQSTLTNLALYRGFNLLTNSITESVASTRELQVNISLIRTLSQDAQLSASAWADSIRRVSGETGFAQNEIAGLYYDIVSNQVAAGAAVEDVARKASELARVVKSSPKEAGNLLSSVINTYGAEAGTLDEVSAKLFKTIDLGRVSAGELQNSFGRVENSGKELGVTFDELLASMSSLTITGLKTDESMTLLFNVMKSLRNPTDGMKAALNELNYSSGSVAVKTDGLFNVLKKLTGAAREGKVDLANLFPDAREQRFIAAFTNDTKTFEDNLNKIKNQSGRTFENAKDIRSESDADKIAKNLEKLKNALSKSAGEQIVKIVSQFVELTGSAENLDQSISKLFDKVVTGGKIVGAFVIAMKGLAVVSEIIAARNLKVSQTIDAQTAATIRNTQAVKANAIANLPTGSGPRTPTPTPAGGKGGLGSFIGGNLALTAGVGIATTLLTDYKQFDIAAGQSFAGVTAAYQELVNRTKDQPLTKELERSVSQANKLKDSFKEVSQTLSRTIGEGLKNNGNALANIQKTIRDTNDDLKSGFVGVLDLASQNLSRLEGELGRIKSASEQINKSQTRQGFRDRAADSIYSTANQFATPNQQLQLLDSEYSAVERKIKNLIKQGTPESLAEVQKLYDKELELTQRYFEQKAGIEYKAFQEDLQRRQQAGEAIGPGGNTFVYDPTKQQQAVNQLVARKEQTEANILKILKEQQRVKEEEIAREKVRIDQQKKAIDNFTGFSIFGNDGKVKDQYRNASGKIDQKRIEDDYSNQEKALRKTVDLNGVDRLNFNEQLNRRKELQRAEVARLKLQEELSTQQQKSVEIQDKASKAIDKTTNNIKKYNEGAAQSAKNTQGALEGIAAVAGEAPGRIADLSVHDEGVNRGVRLKRLADVQAEKAKEGLGFETDSSRERAKFESLANEANSLKAELDKAQKNLIDVGGQKVVDPAKVQAIQARSIELAKALKALIEKEKERRGLTGGQGGSYFIPGTTESLDTLLERTLNEQKDFQKLGPSLSQGTDFSRQANQLSELQAKAEEAAKSYEANNTGLLGLVGGFGVATQLQIQNLDALIRKAQEAQGILGGIGGGAPERRAYGGPIGSDSRMAWVKGGEYVMNDRATSQFYSRINSMNNMSRVPERFSSGGPVTNMNGMTLNINEARDAGMTGRDVHRMLKRIKRTGRI